MPLPVALSYSGTAVSTTTSSTLSSIDTSVTLTAVTGWPSSGTFFVAIDPGLSSEEKCLATRAGSTLTLTRAQDGTTGVAHVSGSVIVHVFTAVDAAAANLVASKLTTKGDVLATDGSTLNRLGIGTDAYVLTADAASTNGFKWAVIPSGKVLQVVTGTTLTTVSNSTTTFEPTTLTQTITPSSTSSKILVFVNHAENAKSSANSENALNIQLFRDATPIVTLQYSQAYTGSALGLRFSTSNSYLDSPNTTSATTYSTKFANDSASASVQVQQIGAAPSTIVLMEISA